MTQYEPMVWRGKSLDTVGALNDMICTILREGTESEAREFMTAYRAINPHADSNVGYLSGYHSLDTMQRIQERFGVGHPIFK